jgi:hypothetical protein
MSTNAMIVNAAAVATWAIACAAARHKLRNAAFPADLVARGISVFPGQALAM